MYRPPIVKLLSLTFGNRITVRMSPNLFVPEALKVTPKIELDF